MAKTPYTDLSSQDILSAHISGLQHSVNKIEEVLNMGTANATNHILRAVVDQQDLALHYIIYEGTIRNWLKSPTPVIYRNGAIVNPSEYTINEAYGVVIFNNQQDPSATITARFTHLIGASTAISDLATQVNSIATIDSRLTSVEGTAVDLENRIVTLEERPTGGDTGGGTVPATGGSYAYSSGGGKLDDDGNLTIPAGDKWLTVGGKDVAEATYGAAAINVGTHNLDAFPFYLPERTTIDKMRVRVGAQNSTGTPTGIMGIYSNADGLPDIRLVQTVTHSEKTAGDIEAAFTTGPVTLEAGLYWIARVSNSTMQIKALSSAFVPALNVPADFPKDGTGTTRGLRTTWSNMTALPAKYPRTATKALGRDANGYCSAEVHVAKVYL